MSLGRPSRPAWSVSLNRVGYSTHRVGPSVPLYAGATALFATALVVWWWAEKDVTL